LKRQGAILPSAMPYFGKLRRGDERWAQPPKTWAGILKGGAANEKWKAGFPPC